LTGSSQHTKYITGYTTSIWLSTNCPRLDPWWYEWSVSVQGQSSKPNNLPNCTKI